MKIKHLLTIVAISGTLVALEGRAASVGFLETDEDSFRVIASNEWLSVSVTRGETSTFTGDLPGNSTGSYTIGLQEFAGGPLSDWLTIDWSPNDNNTTFMMVFQSDTEAPLQPPPGRTFDVLAPETGHIQGFTIPSTAFSVTVDLLSDVEPVPDGGATIILLGLSSAGLAVFRRFRK